MYQICFRIVMDAENKSRKKIQLRSNKNNWKRKKELQKRTIRI